MAPAKAQKLVAKAQRQKRSDITMGDLPRETREQFNKIFIPYLVEWIGQQSPWHQQTDEEVIAAWARVLPEVELNERVRLAVAKLVSQIQVSTPYILLNYSCVSGR